MPYKRRQNPLDCPYSQGFLDADGAVVVGVGRFVNKISLAATQITRSPLDQVKKELGGTIYCKPFIRGEKCRWELRETQEVLKALKCLETIPKKGRQVKAAIDYLENRITGDQLATIMNQEYKTGHRANPVKLQYQQPHTRKEGIHLATTYARKRRKRYPRKYRKILEKR